MLMYICPGECKDYRILLSLLYRVQQFLTLPLLLCQNDMTNKDAPVRQRVWQRWGADCKVGHTSNSATSGSSCSTIGGGG